MEANGDIEAKLSIGFVSGQVTSDGRLWNGYGDEEIFAGNDLTAEGIACFDMNGVTFFGFNSTVNEKRSAPPVWSAAGINVVTDDEVWVFYYADGAPEPDSEPDEYYTLAQIKDYEIARLIPWRIVLEQAPASPPDTFAIHDERLLLQGYGHGLGESQPDASHPHARLYVVPLNGGGATELLPVDESGNWIGPFRAEGRGSRIYLATSQRLWMVDLATL